MKKQFRFFMFILIFFCGLVLFTNCNRIESTPSADSKTEIFKSNNNGYSYGGKIEGQFARLIPNFTCSGSVSPAALVDVDGQQLLVQDFIDDGCGSTKDVADFSLFEFSKFQNQVFGYKKFIFERVTDAVVIVPNRLVETWCSAKLPSGQHVELMSFFNRSLAVSETQIILSSLGAGPEAPLVKNLASYRVQTADGIEINSDQEFQLRVHRNQTDDVGRFMSNLRLKVQSSEIETAAHCRLGGSLDSHIWPLKPFIETSFHAAEIAANGKWAAIRFKKDGSTDSELQALNFEMRSLGAKVVEKSLSSYFFNFDAESSFVHFQNKSGLQAYDLSSGKVTPLFSKPNSSVLLSSRYFLDSLKKSAYFTSYMPTPTPSLQLQKLDLETGVVKGLGPVFSGGISDLNFSKPNQKIVFLCCNAIHLGALKNSLYVIDAATGSVTVVNHPSLQDPEYSIAEFFVPNDEFLRPKTQKRFYILRATTSTFTKPQKFFLLDLLSDDLVELPHDADVWTGPIELETTILFSRILEKTKNFVYKYNAVDKKFESIEHLERRDSSYRAEHFFEKNGEILSATRIDEGKMQFLSFSSAAPSVKLCQELKFDDFVIDQSSTETSVLAVTRSGLGLNLVAIDLSLQSCRVLNKIPIGLQNLNVSLSSTNEHSIRFKWLAEFKINVQKTHVALKLRTQSYDLKSDDELYVIPLDGQSGIRVNYPGVNAGHIMDFGFVGPQKSLYFWGGEKAAALNKIYVFDF